MSQALKDEDWGVRVNAAWSLGGLNDTRAVDPLIQALKDEDSWVRQNATLSLGKLNDTRAVDPLIQALKDEDSGVRVNAAWSLAQLKDARAVGPLIQALADKDWGIRGVRMYAAWSLAWLNDTRAVGPLIQALKDEDSLVRQTAAWSLGWLNDTRAVGPLSQALKDEDSLVRQTAAKSLDQLRFRIEGIPQSWNLPSACPGTSARAKFSMKNVGETLQNLSYTGMIENTTLQEIQGTVLPKKVWEYPVNTTESTKKISARLLSDDRTNTSELMLVFEDPSGEPVDALLGSSDLGPLEITNSEEAPWKVKVYGYEVPDAGQSFRVLLKSYDEAPWSWIETLGPEEIESNENWTIEANLTIPEDTSLSRVDGYIKISSDSHTFEIPVSVTIAGSGQVDEDSKVRACEELEHPS